MSKNKINRNNSILDFHPKKLLHKNISRNLANIYVSIFSNYIQFWRLIYIWNI